MESNFRPGDRIVTKVDGLEVEASVIRLSVELEVKTPDGRLWWRALSRVRPVVEASSTEVGEMSAASPVVGKIVDLELDQPSAHAGGLEAEAGQAEASAGASVAAPAIDDAALEQATNPAPELAGARKRGKTGKGPR